jgi:hypothetical protein
LQKQGYESEWEREANIYKKILVPLDGSELAECSLSHVTNPLKNDPAAEVVLLSAVIVEPPWREIERVEDGRGSGQRKVERQDGTIQRTERYRD